MKDVDSVMLIYLLEYYQFTYIYMHMTNETFSLIIRLRGDT